jgi:amidase
MSQQESQPDGPKWQIGFEPPYQGKRLLDFIPFEDALQRLDTVRQKSLDSLLHEVTIDGLHKLYREKQLTCTEAVLYYLARIRRLDVGKLQSVCELNPDVLSIAQAIDARLAAGEHTPLLGVPILLKDNIGTGDAMHNTAGAKALEHARCSQDAFLVARLREAGAVILGKANLSEWAYYMSKGGPSGFSVLGGQTRNPYGVFDPLGSSTGSAVAVAANLAVVSIGTETTGSITAPAARNGVVGIKPSLGLVSRDLIIPISEKMDTAGPFARTVKDAAIVLSVLASTADQNDSTSHEGLFGLQYAAVFEQYPLRGARIGLAALGLSESEADQKVRQYMRLSVADLQPALDVLRKAGAELVEINIGGSDAHYFDYAPVLNYGLRQGVNAYLNATQAPIHSLAEIIAFNQSDPTNRMPYGQAQLEDCQAEPITPTDYEVMASALLANRRALIEDALKVHRLDALVTMANVFSAVYAPAGYPAISVPAGFSPEGEPFSFTFVGGFQQDARIISYAYHMEQAGPMRKPPLGF